MYKIRDTMQTLTDPKERFEQELKLIKLIITRSKIVQNCIKNPGPASRHIRVVIRDFCDGQDWHWKVGCAWEASTVGWAAHV
jgi:hypothetical protein